MVEVAENDGHPLTLLTERVRHRYADFVERHECRARSSGVRGLDRLGRKFVATRHKNDSVPALGLTTDGKVIRERAVRDPPDRTRQWRTRNLTPRIVLFGARYDPLVTIFVCVCLHPTNIASRECLADRQTNEFLSCQDVWDDLGLQLRRAKVEDGGQADYVPGEQAVHVPTCSTTPELGVDDELDVT